METTIEERAKESLRIHYDESFRTFNTEHRSMREWEYGYCQGATEQDRIARQEEREKAELSFCIACDSYDCCEQRYNCDSFNKFSKAMEGGKV